MIIAISHTPIRQAMLQWEGGREGGREGRGRRGKTSEHKTTDGASEEPAASSCSRDSNDVTSWCGVATDGAGSQGKKIITEVILIVLFQKVKMTLGGLKGKGGAIISQKG